MDLWSMTRYTKRAYDWIATCGFLLAVLALVLVAANAVLLGFIYSMNAGAITLFAIGVLLHVFADRSRNYWYFDPVYNRTFEKLIWTGENEHTYRGRHSGYAAVIEGTSRDGSVRTIYEPLSEKQVDEYAQFAPGDPII